MKVVAVVVGKLYYDLRIILGYCDVQPFLQSENSYRIHNCAVVRHFYSVSCDDSDIAIGHAGGRSDHYCGKSGY